FGWDPEKSFYVPDEVKAHMADVAAKGKDAQAAWEKMFAEYGINFSFDDYKEKVDGIPRIDGAKAILVGADDSKIEEAATRKQEIFLDLISKDKIPAYNSTVDFIKLLKTEQKLVAFASSSKNCKRILKRVGIIDLADTIIDGNDLTKGKPDPQIFQLAAKALKCEAKDCAVFEDALLGVEASKNAGMVSVGIDRYNEPSRLNKADIVINDLAELSLNKLEELFIK
ncbi:MAG: HAD-IA family hydrolase, partial [Candidatus Omnitrophota bacterium]